MNATPARRPKGLILLATVLGLVGFWFAPSAARAQSETGAGVSPEGSRTLVIENARSIRGSRGEGLLYVTGNVRVRSDPFKVRADRMVYDQNRNLVFARGNVKLTKPGPGGDPIRIQTKALRFNPRTNRILTDDVQAHHYPWNFSAARSDGDADTTIRLVGAMFSTDRLDHRHYDIRATSVYVNSRELVAWNVRFYVGSIPVFYFPYVSVSMEQGGRWEVRPGHNSNTGFMVDVNYHYLMGSDPGPWTTTFYSNFTQGEKAGLGFDLGYNRGFTDFYLFAFGTRRKPFLIDSSGDEFQAPRQQSLYEVRGEVDHQLIRDLWSVRGEIDWVGESRFNQGLTVTTDVRAESERTVDLSLIRNGDDSIFRVDLEREDRAQDGDLDDGFRTIKDQFRVNYNLFSTPIHALGPTLYYRTETNLRNREVGRERLWDGTTNHSLLRTVAWTSWLGQSYRVGYEQEVQERSTAGGSSTDSVGSMEFVLRNALELTPRMDLDVSYNLKQRLNDRDQVTFSLSGGPTFTEEEGRDEHDVGFNARWDGDWVYGFLRGGYDLRQPATGSVDSQDRLLPLQLNMTSQINRYWHWDQFMLYSLADQRLQQIDTQWRFEISPRMLTEVAWNFSRRSGTDFSEIDGRFMWKLPGDRWRVGTELSWDLKNREFQETQLMLYRQLHHWEMRLYFSQVEDRDSQIGVTFNLKFYPGKLLGTGAEGRFGFREDYRRDNR